LVIPSVSAIIFSDVLSSIDLSGRAVTGEIGTEKVPECEPSGFFCESECDNDEKQESYLCPYNEICCESGGGAFHNVDAGIIENPICGNYICEGDESNEDCPGDCPNGIIQKECYIENEKRYGGKCSLGKVGCKLIPGGISGDTWWTRFINTVILECKEEYGENEFTCVNSKWVETGCKYNPILNGVDYIVATRENSSFKELAEYFADGKEAHFTTFTSIDSLIYSLQKSNPTYLAIVLSPEEMFPDLVNEIDEKLRDVDDDPFLDISYGYITSFTLEDGCMSSKGCGHSSLII